MAGASVSCAAYADSGTIEISEIKGGWFIGASGGSGTLTFHGRRYPLAIGGMSAGFVFGASKTTLWGQVSSDPSAHRTSKASTGPPVPAPRSEPERA